MKMLLHNSSLYMKTYRLQIQDCIKNSTRFEVPCVSCSHINYICSKYKAYCTSSLCIDERLTDKEKVAYYRRKIDGTLKGLSNPFKSINDHDTF